MINPYAIAATALAGVTLFGAGYYKGTIGEMERQSKVEQVVRDSRAAMLETAADAIAGIEVKHVTIRQQATREVIRDPVYRDCSNTAEFMQLLNGARGFPDWQPFVPGELPAAPTDR